MTNIELMILILCIMVLFAPVLFFRFERRSQIRRDIRRRLAEIGRPNVLCSLCCGVPTKPLGWTEEGWVSTCCGCGAWQYLGDDHDNPPIGFNRDGTPWTTGDERLSSSNPRFSIMVNNNPVSSETIIHAGDEITIHRESIIRHLRPPDETVVHGDDTADHYRFTPEVTSETQAFPFLGRIIGPDEDQFIGGDEGEPLLTPAQPNLGGEGNPDYKGPHYDLAYSRFVPYDMLHDPIPGTAVTEEDQRHADDIAPD